MATTASQKTSTAPTSTQPPEHPIRPSSEFPEPNHGLLFNSNTLPALAGRGSHKSRALPSSITWTSSSGDLDMFSDTDEIQDRRDFVQEYNRLAKKVRVLSLLFWPLSSAETMFVVILDLLLTDSSMVSESLW